MNPQDLASPQRYIKSAADLLPVIGFFGVFFFFGRDIMIATTGLVIGLCTQIVIYLLLRIPIPTWMKVLTGIGVFFAVITLLFNDPVFIKVRSTVTGTLVGCVFLGSVLIKKNILQMILRHVIDFPQKTWNMITMLWVIPIFGNAALNLVIANQMPGVDMEFSHDTWMTYRLVGGFVVVATSLALVAIYLYLTKQKPQFTIEGSATREASTPAASSDSAVVDTSSQDDIPTSDSTR